MSNIDRTFTLGSQTVNALRNVSLSVCRGEFVSIVGPSGSGKSTLLMIMGGLLAPTRGDVSIDGVAAYDVTAVERASIRREKIGFMFQTFNLVPYLSSLENVMVPLYLAGKSGREQDQRARELLDRFSLSHRLDHKPGELSVGERQRAALARALANDPDYILADEPTGNLDEQMTAEILRGFEQLTDAGKTIVLVTHDQELSVVADRIIKLVDGRIVSTIVNSVVESETM